MFTLDLTEAFSKEEIQPTYQLHDNVKEPDWYIFLNQLMVCTEARNINKKGRILVYFIIMETFFKWFF